MKTCTFYSHPSFYVRLDQTLSKCIASFKKIKVQNFKNMIALYFKTLPYSFCACVRNTPKKCDICHWKDETGVDAFPPRPKMPFTYVINIYSDMSLSKGHLGSRGGGGGI